MAIRGKRIYLRELQPDDASEEYVEWMKDHEVTKYITARNLNFEDVKAYITEKKNARDCLFFGIFDNETNMHLGNIKLEPIDGKKATIGLLIGNKNYWGKGIGQEAMSLALDYAFAMLGICELNLGVASEHLTAIRLYEKLGFRIEKINKGGCQFGGRSHDQLIMVKTRDESHDA